MKATLLLSFSVVLTLPGLICAELMPGAVYQAVACGGSYAPCDITPFVREPGASERAGLNSELFATYFEASGVLRGTNRLFQWAANGSNDNGFVFGSVFGGNSIHAQFLYDQNAIICCVTDEPFRITGINNNNLIVGFNPYQPMGSSYGFLAYAGPAADRHNIPLTILPDPQAGLPAPFEFSRWTGIDNQNRILVEGEQNFVLEPQSVPEPGGVVLLGTSLAFGWLLKRRLSAPKKS